MGSTRLRSRELLSLFIAGLLVLAFASPAFAVDTGEVCVDQERYTGAYVCGIVVVTLVPGVDIDALVDGCEPAPIRIDPPPDGASDPSGTLPWVVVVPNGSEIDLMNCYASQPNVAGAALAGVGELTPDTAMHRWETPVAPVAFLLSVLFLLAAHRLGSWALRTVQV